jgi:hypothetical protein
MLMGQARPVHPSSITATGFVLVDAQGRTRAVPKMSKCCSPELALFDENGELRATLAASSAGPALTFYDADGKTRAELFTLAKGPGSI